MSLPELEHHTVRAVDGTRLAVQTYGQGPLTIAIANGLGGTLLAWTPLLRALSDRVRFVSWDYRGLYGSEVPRNPRSLGVGHHVSDLNAVCDALGVDRFVLAGWSMGVQVSVQAAADLGDRVMGLVLINGTYGRVFETAFVAPGSRRLLPLINSAAIAIGPLMPPVVSRVTQSRLFMPLIARLGLVDQRLDQEVFLAIAQGFKDLDFRVYHQIMAQLNMHDGESALRTIKAPTLFVAGDKDNMTPHSVVETFERHMPTLETFVVRGGTHYSLLEYPAEVVGRVTRFLDDNFAASAVAAQAHG